MDADLLQQAQRHLSRRDKVLRPLIRGIGPCTLQPASDYFGVLVRSIVAQQISTKAAQSISAKLLKAVGRFQPARILAAPELTLREAGLSQNKLISIRDLAAKCQDGTVPLRRLKDMEDEAIVESLVQVRGIGVWTAEMFLIFSLGRTDVFPVGDYGLRAGVQRHYQLPELPKKDALQVIGEPWKPFRSIGTWYIWRSLGGVPQSDA